MPEKIEIVTDEMFADLCNIIWAAWCNVEEVDPSGIKHTSAISRKYAGEIMDVLGLEFKEEV